LGWGFPCRPDQHPGPLRLL